MTYLTFVIASFMTLSKTGYNTAATRIESTPIVTAETKQHVLGLHKAMSAKPPKTHIDTPHTDFYVKNNNIQTVRLKVYKIESFYYWKDWLWE